MQKDNPGQSRKKFLFTGLAAVSFFGIGRFLFRKKKKAETVKMLTEDGKLVEVDISRIRKTGVKVDNESIHTWIKNKPTTKN